jgi:hypothetical protein
MKRLCIFLSMLLAVSCQGTSGVYRVGQNTYRVTTRATWEFGGREGAMHMALDEATQTCASKDKKLRVISSTSHYGHFEGGTVDLIFTCE